MVTSLMTSRPSAVRPLRAARPRTAAPQHAFSPVKARQGAPPTQAEPAIAQKMLASMLAASIAISAGPAFATESGIMPSRNRGEDSAARSFLNKKETKQPIQSPSLERLVDGASVAGASQAKAATPTTDPSTTRDWLQGHYPWSDIPGFRGSSSPAARKAAELMDIDEVLKGITPAPKKYAPARPDATTVSFPATPAAPAPAYLQA